MKSFLINCLGIFLVCMAMFPVLLGLCEFFSWIFTDTTMGIITYTGDKIRLLACYQLIVPPIMICLFSVAAT